jgi:hypothetical protein
LTDSEKPDVELRGMTPRAVVDVLDAVSTAKRISRMELVNRILHSYMVDKLAEHTLIDRVARGNPLLLRRASDGAECAGKGVE